MKLFRPLLSLVIITAMGCSKRPPPSGDSAPVTAASTRPSATPPGASTNAGTTPAGPKGLDGVAAREEPLLQLTRQWNSALTSHQVGTLSAVYGTSVRLYGEQLSRAEAIARKSSALSKAKDYTQHLGRIAIDWKSRTRPRALFEKQWTANGRPGTVLGSLAFAQEGDRWVVVEESDEKTDQYIERHAAKAGTCEDAAMLLVLSTKEASAMLNGPTDPAHGHTSNGGRIEADAWPNFQVAIHENHEDHLATLGWFKADVVHGTVAQLWANASEDETPLRVEPKASEAARRACTKR